MTYWELAMWQAALGLTGQLALAAALIFGLVCVAARMRRD